MSRTLILFSASFLAGLLLARGLRGSLADDTLVFYWMIGAVLPAVLASLLQKSSSAGIRQKGSTKISIRRLVNKSFALFAGCSLVLILAMAGTLLNIEPFKTFLDDFLPVYPILAVCIPVYVVLFERLTGITNDDHSCAGARILGQDRTPWSNHRRWALSWLVKAFFIPLMYGWLHSALTQLLNLGMPSQDNWTVWLFSIGLSIDLLIATAGYIFASKLFQSEVISVDGTWTGWLVCLLCYPPLLQHLRTLTTQVDNYTWTDWLDPSQVLYWVWASAIVASWMVYWLSTVAFGLKFSNLSYRGLISSGPYRWCKHPAYLAKNVYWWIHTVPFFGILGTGELVRNIAGLSLLSLVYFLRAKTEERHLSKFTEYRAYARAMDGKFPWKYLRRNPDRELQPFPH